VRKSALLAFATVSLLASPALPLLPQSSISAAIAIAGKIKEKGVVAKYGF